MFIWSTAYISWLAALYAILYKTFKISISLLKTNFARILTYYESYHLEMA